MGTLDAAFAYSEVTRPIAPHPSRENSSMQSRSIVVAAFALAACGALFAATAQSPPFVGQWQWNRAESSSQASGAPPRQQVLAIASADRARVQWSMTIVDAQGQQHVESFTGTGDGKPVQVSGAPEATQGSFTVTATALESHYTSRDGSSDHASCTLSPDRKKMTCRGTESDGKGHANTYVDVYDRK
jgi:hypothetical protein